MLISLSLSLFRIPVFLRQHALKAISHQQDHFQPSVYAVPAILSAAYVMDQQRLTAKPVPMQSSHQTAQLSISVSAHALITVTSASPVILSAMVAEVPPTETAYLVKSLTSPTRKPSRLCVLHSVE